MKQYRLGWPNGSNSEGLLFWQVKGQARSRIKGIASIDSYVGRDLNSMLHKNSSQRNGENLKTLVGTERRENRSRKRPTTRLLTNETKISATDDVCARVVPSLTSLTPLPNKSQRQKATARAEVRSFAV